MAATERFFSGMSQHVALEMRSSCIGEIALCANKRPLTTMNQGMVSQFAGPIAFVIALVASVGLLFIIQRLHCRLGKIVCSHFHVCFFFQPRIFYVVICEIEG